MRLLRLGVKMANQRIRIKTYLIVGIMDNALSIGTSPKLQYTINDPDMIARVKEMLPFLKGDYTASEVVEKLQHRYDKGEIEEIVRRMSENKVLETVPAEIPAGFAHDEFEMYSRNLLFYDMFAFTDRTAVDYQLELKQSHVVIVGLHGVGAQTLLMLNQTGVGNITGIDSGKVDKFHLNSKILYQYEDIGKDKGEVLSRRIGELNPFTSFQYVDYHQAVKAGGKTIREILGKADCVVFCLDVIAGVGDLVEEICIPGNIPYLFVGKRKNIGFVGPFFMPGKTACPLCSEKLAREIWEHQTAAPGLARKVLSFNKEITFSPIDTLLGNYAAADIIRFLTHFEKLALLNKQFQYDEAYYVLSNKAVYRNPECRNCKDHYDPRRHGVLKINDKLSLYDNSLCEFADFIPSGTKKEIDGIAAYPVTLEGKPVTIFAADGQLELLILLKNGYSLSEAFNRLRGISRSVSAEFPMDAAPFLTLLFFAGFIKSVDGYPASRLDLLDYSDIYMKFNDFSVGKEGEYYCMRDKEKEENRVLLPEASMKAVELLNNGRSVEETRKEIMREYNTDTLNITPLMETLFEKGFVEYIRLGG
jgi:bacteriocin biosynthesis cyclodehydratase domain-containing protein